MNINHATRLSFNREFYALDLKTDGTLDLHVRVLNIFQRALRFLFGIYSNTIWNQQRSTQVRNLYPEEWQKIENQIQNPAVFKQVFKIPKSTLSYIENEEFYEEKDETKIIETFHWVLDNFDDSEDQTQRAMRLFIDDLLKKSRTEGIRYERTYISWIETLNEEQLATYIRLLPIKGSDSALLYHLNKEFHTASLTGKTDKEKIANRVKIAFSQFTANHAKAIFSSEDFWNLLYEFPSESAESLKPEVLAIIAKRKTKHKLVLKKMIFRLPDDDLLYDKLMALAPYSTTDIEMALRTKAERLLHYNFKVNGGPVSKNGKKALKDDILSKMDAGLKTPQLETEKKEEFNSLENVKSRNSRSYKFQSQSMPNFSNVTTATPAPVVAQTAAWPDDQCIRFLTEKKYKRKDDAKGEEIVFKWILNHEDLYYDDETMHAAIDAFVKHSLSKTLYAENTEVMLHQMDENQLSFFVNLLGTERIDVLWNLEAKGAVAQSSVKKKIKRLKTILGTLSEEQFEVSLDSVKFYEILRSYTQELAPLLSTDQWRLMAAQSAREDQILQTLIAMVSNLDKNEDSEFTEKLEVVSCLLLERNENASMKQLREELKNRIQKKLIFCPKDIQKKITACL